MISQAIVQHMLDMGAYKAAMIEVKKIHFDRNFRAMCEANACGNYGRNWMCPPDAGDIDDLINRARSFSCALVYQTIGELEDSYDFEGMMAAGKTHNDLARRISDWVETLRLPRYMHLGAGGCRLCDVCGKQTGELCRHPDRALASLETYGIAVSELAASCGMKYINGQNTVTYFGALFLDNT